MHASHPIVTSVRNALLIAILTMVAACGNASDNPTGPDDSELLSRQIPPPFASTERVIFEQINQHRVTVGLPPLKFDATISAVARMHCEQMASKAIPLSHKGFSQRLDAIGKVIPIDDATENVSYNFSTDGPVSFLLYTWLNNPLMKNGIEGRYDYTGVGVAQAGPNEYYVTEIFVRKK